MLRNPLTWLLLFIVSTALAACCGSVACDCQDSLDDAIFFDFNLDPSSSTRFDSAAVGTVFIVRQLLRDTARRPGIDTVALVRTRQQWGNSVVLNNAQPFSQRGNRKLDRYFYTLYLGARRAPTTSFRIDSVKLSNRLESDGCCTCNRNTRKLVYLNGQTTPRDLTDPAGKDQPIPVLLTR
ncbi:MAG TPA: hypothetical protein VK364_06135 [Hymenobacter sp.]|nr:hypothetical protein [Hymenobacter sp.]